MMFSDTSNLNGLLQDIDFRCSTDSVAYPTKDKTRNINIAYDKVWEFMSRKAKRVKFADTALTPPYNLALYNTVSGTALVSITEPFKFERAEVQDAGGKWTKLELIDENDIETAIGEFETVNGTPKYIRINGNRATLYPAPNFTVTGGLAIYGMPAQTIFASTDTTAVPLVPRFAHSLLSIEASLAYCNIYKQDRVPQLVLQLRETYDQLEDYLQDRDKTNFTLVPQQIDAQ